MNQFQKFEQAIDITINDKNKITVIPNKDYFVGNTPHGGYLMALMHKALTGALPHSSAISSSVQYLDRISTEPFDLIIDKFKVSRGSSSGIVKLVQDNKVCTTFVGTCTDLHHIKGFSGLKIGLPDIYNSANRDEYVNLNFDMISKGFTPSFIKQINCEIHPDHAWWLRKNNEPEKFEARCTAFLEMEGGMPNQFCLSFFSDILPPVVSNKYGALGWIPTITLTTHIRQLPKTNQLFADFVASEINKGYFEQDCNIWDLEGNLVASSRQLTRILKSDERLGKIKK